MNSKSKQKPIAFFYPTRAVGGAQLLFARLALKLIQAHQTVLIVDYKDGFIKDYINSVTDQFVYYEYVEGVICEVSEEVCLIQHLSSYPSLHNKIKLQEESRILFWSIHPYNIFAFYRFTPIYTRVNYNWTSFINKYLEPIRSKKVANWINMANNANALYFMDHSNYLPLSKMDLLKGDPKYIPIPIEGKAIKKRRVDFSTINIAWIGRVTEAKVHPFNAIVSRLDKSGIEYKIIFHVIGFGELGAIDTCKNITVVNHGIVKGKELQELLLSSIDAVIAMGTSLLEAASLGIPSVLTDLSKRPVPDAYRFKWIFDSQNFDLGTSMEYANGKLSIVNMLDSLVNREHYYDIANKCLHYVNVNHQIDTVICKVKMAVNATTLRQGKFGVL